MTTFDKINIQAQVVNGKCPHCTEDSIFVSIYKTIFRCVTCGSDLEQKINIRLMKKNCNQCKAEFEAKQESDLFCSQECKQEALAELDSGSDECLSCQ